MPRLMLRSNSKNQLISQEEALKRAYKKFRPDEDDLKHEYCPAKIEEVIESVTADIPHLISRINILVPLTQAIKYDEMFVH